MTWLTGKQYNFSFSTFPRFCGIKDNWIVKLFTDKYEKLDLNIFEKKSNNDTYKILIKEKEKDVLKLLHTNDINVGDIIKLDIDTPKNIEYLLYYEIVKILPDNKVLLNRPVLQELDLTFLERSNLTGIYQFDFTPATPGFYNFEISNPKHFIKPFGKTIQVKDKLFIQELIETYTEELNNKFRIENTNPINPPTGVNDSVWFNNESGEVWIWNEEKRLWIKKD